MSLAPAPAGDTLPEHPRQHFAGADVRWVSQYPLEDEVLYPHGVILCPIRASRLSNKRLYTFIPATLRPLGCLGTTYTAEVADGPGFVTLP